jgi:nitrite reductase/ring-hydroxylating ferredoxin subunit/Fe-S cluster biogenesis protein NfuA
MTKKEEAVTDQLPAGKEPDQSFDQIVQRLDSLVQVFEQHPIVQVREEAMEMLGLIDALHRAGIQRLVEALRKQESGLLEQLLKYPSVEVLLTLYDLMPPEPFEQVEAVLEALGPYIASYGYTVEVLDVIDGVVQLCLSGSGNGVAGSTQALMHEIEKSLREGFPGFRSIEMREPVEAPRTGSFIPLQQVGPLVRTIKRPVFTPVAPVESLQPGTLKGVEAQGIRILLCNLEGEIYAYRNACPGSVLPLDLGELKGHTLHCPWHNCLYDIRTGKRLDGGTGRLQVIPATIRDGMIQLALDVESVPLSVAQAPGKSSGGRTN